MEACCGGLDCYCWLLRQAKLPLVFMASSSCRWSSCPVQEPGHTAAAHPGAASLPRPRRCGWRARRRSSQQQRHPRHSSHPGRTPRRRRRRSGGRRLRRTCRRAGRWRLMRRRSPTSGTSRCRQGGQGGRRRAGGAAGSGMHSGMHSLQGRRPSLQAAGAGARVQLSGPCSLCHMRAPPAWTADKEGAVGQANGRHAHQLELSCLLLLFLPRASRSARFPRCPPSDAH